MRITLPSFILIGVLAVGGLVVSAQQPKYAVKVILSNTAVLEKAKTYSWTKSQPSPIKTIDAQIVAAVDRELGGLGFTKVASGKSDVLATYASVQRTDVDLKSKADANGVRKTFPVGTLVVDLRDPATRKAVFRVRIDKPLDADPDKLEAAINEAVKEMFELYPTRTAAKK